MGYHINFRQLPAIANPNNNHFSLNLEKFIPENNSYSFRPSAQVKYGYQLNLKSFQQRTSALAVVKITCL